MLPNLLLRLAREAVFVSVFHGEEEARQEAEAAS
jgi:peptidoglycan biosynthesis protein MviN/MurJ (putative lipid II flippase)